MYNTMCSVLLICVKFYGQTVLCLLIDDFILREDMESRHLNIMLWEAMVWIVQWFKKIIVCEVC